MIIKKTWLTVLFEKGDAGIECTLNYSTKKFSLTHGSNDNNVTFMNEPIKNAIDRANCVMAALKFIKTEFDDNP